MTVNSRRSKMVTFRVSMEEFQSLEEACISRRARSISEVARSAVQQWIRETSLSSPFDNELQQVERRIQVLAKELERLQYLVQLQRTVPARQSTPQ
ncbi:MAG: hypothetical protein ABSE42_09495 [Bryobacteraceae bacterium]